MRWKKFFRRKKALPTGAETQKVGDGDRRKPPLETVLDRDATSLGSDSMVPPVDLTSPVAATVAVDAQALQTVEAQVATEWQEGEVILDLYEVKKVHTSGGMGLVYRVHHKGWNLDLAVKSPRTEFFKTKELKAAFVRECETWIDLGLHPHTVSCYYVRTLGGIPRVFAEYIEGGSLTDWIRDGRLYAGGPAQALARMLDIAIQFAWGLEYAHEQGLVHQDVKPANLMLTPEGVAKVTDFGLARAKAWAAVTAGDVQDRTVLVKGGGMTPAYCSPEQASDEPLSRRTDIWSWGLSILEMFAGWVFWATVLGAKTGQLAPQALEHYLQEGAERKDIPPMPPALAELLRQCFQQDPKARPHDFGVVASALEDSYQQEIGRPYPQQKPKAVELKADSLNNKALSLLDLRRREEAEQTFDAALQADPHHPEATYNRGLLLWRTARMTDDVLVKQLEEVRRSHPHDWCDEYYLGLIHLERRDAESAIKVLEEAAKREPDVSEIQQALKIARSGKRRSCWATIGKGWYTSISFISNRLALVGNSRNLEVWEVAKLQCVRTLKGHVSSVNSVAVSPNGAYGLSGSAGKALKLWDLATGQCIRTFGDHSKEVNTVSISPDGRWGLSGSDDKALKLWELATGQCIRTFEGHSKEVNTVSISPDGRWGLSGSDDETLKLWELTTGQCIRTFEGHTGKVTSVSINPDGRWAVSGSSDTTLKLWELSSGKCLGTFEGHKAWTMVNSVSISPDGYWAVSGGWDGTMRLWEIATGRCVRTFEALATQTIECISFGPTVSPIGYWGLLGITSGPKRRLMLWTYGSSEFSGIYAFAFPRSVKRVAELETAVREAMKKVRSALKEGLVSNAAIEVAKARRLPGYERNSELLEFWREAGRRGMCSGFSSGWFLLGLEGHKGKRKKAPVNSVSISPDSRWGLSGSLDVRLWDLTSGECVRTFEGHKGHVSSVCVSPDGRYGLSGSDDKTLKLWELATGQCIRTFEGHKGWVRSVSISPDGRYGLSGSDDKTLKLWELATGQCIRTFEGHKGHVSSVCVSPDGRYGLSGSFDGSLRLWELATGQCIRTFEGHKDWVSSVSISPDSRWAMSSGGFVTGGDCTLRLWELSTGRCFGTLEGHESWVLSVSISPDSHWVFSGSFDGSLRLWELVWDYEFPDTAAWTEEARPYLDTFLTLHTPYLDTLPRERAPTEEEIKRALTRGNPPTWTEEDFQQLLTELGYRGYGWLRPKGVRRELEMMTRDWRGPPSLS